MFVFCLTVSAKGIKMHVFKQILQRETTFKTSCLLPWPNRPFQNGIYSERKEFAPRGANEGQILFFKN